MRTLLTTLILFIAGTGLAFAGGGYGQYGYGHDGYDRGGYDRRGYVPVARAADRLESATRHFYKQMKHDSYDRHAAKDAKRLSRAAKHFNRQVERSRNFRHLQRDYADLVNEFTHVRGQIMGRHVGRRNGHLRRDFRDVQFAFDDLDRAIRYTRHGYHDNRYDHYGRHYGRHDSGLSISISGNLGK